MTKVVNEALGPNDDVHARDAHGRAALDAFAATGFVGCTEGPEDLATEAKSCLRDYLASKFETDPS